MHVVMRPRSTDAIECIDCRGEVFVQECFGLPLVCLVCGDLPFATEECSAQKISAIWQEDGHQKYEEASLFTY